MKNFTYIFALLIVTGILFTGCYTQLATRDRNYSEQGNQNTGNDNTYQDQNQDYAYEDTSQYYDDSTAYYDDSSGYYANDDNYYNDNSYYDRGYNSPYYYDSFYSSYPSYTRYFWGYHPSIAVGLSWNSWGYNPFFYDPFYCGYWSGWNYPGYWHCLPFNYYYPSPWFFSYNYYYGGGYPSYSHYYTTRERTREMSRIRNLDGLRNRGGRNPVSLTGTRNSGRNLTERQREDTRISTRNGNSTGKFTDKNGRGNTIRDINSTRIRTQKEKIKRESDRKSSRENIDRNKRTFPPRYTNPPRKNSRGETRKNNQRIVPNERKSGTSNIEKRNNARIRPHNYNPKQRQYSPPRRSGNTRNYTPPKREGTQNHYTPPQRNSSPPRSYSPPQRNSNPSSNSGSRSGSNGSGRSRR